MNALAVQSIDPEMKKILKLPAPFQIGMVVQDLDKAIRCYSELFGIGPWSVVYPRFIEKMYRGKPAQFQWRTGYARMGELTLELINVIQGPTIYQDEMGEKGEGLHHLGFLVDNIDERVQAAHRIGLAVTQSARRPEVKSKWAYLDTRFIAGVTLELIQRPYAES